MVAGIEENPAQNFSEVQAANFLRNPPWPFLLDQWGKGRAFRCAPADCGVEVNVYVRAKIGFCNCLTGVSDDEELDRVGDVSLISEMFVPLRGGQPVKVGWMSGRSRTYDAAPRYEDQAQCAGGGVQRQVRRGGGDRHRAAHGAGDSRARRAGVPQQRSPC